MGRSEVTAMPFHNLETSPERRLKWDLRYLEMAKLVATWSRDPSTKVGAVIARRDKTVLSLGFNGFPRGCDDDPGLYSDRERKYERVVHAEMNAILSAPERPVGCMLYVWPPSLGPTCARCAAGVIQAGITRVVYVHRDGGAFNERWQASLNEAKQMYRECGIEVVAITEEQWTKAQLGEQS